MHPAPQLATVPALLQHPHVATGLQRPPVGLLTPRQADTEPLARDRVAILEATDADIALRNTAEGGQPLQQFHAVEIAFLQVKEYMLALAG